MRSEPLGITLRVLIFLAAIAAPLSSPTAKQTTQNPPTASGSSANAEGDWVGVLKSPAGRRLNEFLVAVHISGHEGTISGTLDFPANGYVEPLATVTVAGDSLVFTQSNGRYEGRWDAPSQSYKGFWTQNNGPRPLDLMRGHAWIPEALPSVNYTHAQRLVRIAGGRRINMFCLGSGGPTAILDASLSAWSLAWQRVQAQFARSTRVCSYDRAGYGFSDAGPMPRDAEAEVLDLHAALAKAGIRPPYLMVGHSLGGSNARLFAYKYPSEVAGLLLIDPGIEHGDRRLPYPPSYEAAYRLLLEHCVAQAKAGKLRIGFVVPGDEDACLDKPESAWPLGEQRRLTDIRRAPRYYEAMASEEGVYYTLTSDELDVARRSLGSIPLIVLSSDKAHYTEDRPKGVDATALYAAWTGAHDDMAKDSTIGQSRIVPGASHWIFNERPGAVIAAFNEVLKTARANGAGQPAPR